MKTTDIFNENSYTSKAMPTVHQMFSELHEAFCGKSSAEYSELRNQNDATETRKAYNEFMKTLTEKQRDLLDDVEVLDAKENVLLESELFAKGFKLGFRLAMELLS